MGGIAARFDSGFGGAALGFDQPAMNVTRGRHAQNAR